MDRALIHRLGAEALGTLILVLFGSAAAVFAGDLGALGGAAGFAIALAVGAWLVGPVSGAHFNPAVTLGLALRRRFPWADVPGYIGAQVVGAFVAGLLLWASYGKTGEAAGLGTTHVARTTGAGLISATVAEAIGTFLLVVTVLVLTAGDRPGGFAAPVGIGVSLGVGILAFGALTGGSFNPARTFGPELVLTIAGGDTDWPHFWVYLIGPALGAVIAAYTYAFVREDAFVKAPVG